MPLHRRCGARCGTSAALLLLLLLLPLTAAAPVVETPLPYGQLRHKPPPRGYVALRAPTATDQQPPLVIDGRLDEPAWRAAPASEPFVDIVGPTGPQPWHQTHVRMLWDDKHLFIGAELEEPRLFADNSLHDSIIFQDADFEVFIDPDGDNHAYYEIEVNGAGAVWDLLLLKPYRNGGPPVNNWETIPPAVPTTETGPTGWRPMIARAHVQGGAINSRRGTTGWSVEMALPWSLLQQAANRRVPPVPGDQWRVNFSRVQWNVTWSEEGQRYVKEPAQQPGYNWVWSPQWQVQMHQPETWGWVQFDAAPVLPPDLPHGGDGGGGAAAAGAASLCPDPTWPARAVLMDVYHAQTLAWQADGRFCESLQDCSRLLDLSDVPRDAVSIEATRVSFAASSKVELPDGSGWLVMVDQTGRLTQTPLGADGSSLPAFNPFDGSSSSSSSLTSGGSGSCRVQEA